MQTTTIHRTDATPNHNHPTRGPSRGRRPVFVQLALFAVLAFVSACVTGSGRPETRTFALAEFDSIETDNSLQLEVTRADAFAVSVTADDNVWDLLDVSREGRTLRVRLRPGTVFTGVMVRAAVSMPLLAALHVAGDGHARLSGFDAATPRLDVDLSGSSDVDGSVNTGALALHVSGFGRATLTGTAASVTVDASGESRVELAGLRTQTATVALSGSSTGSVTVENTLDYDLSGFSRLVYFGNPRVGTSHTSGGSSAEPR